MKNKEFALKNSMKFFSLKKDVGCFPAGTIAYITGFSNKPSCIILNEAQTEKEIRTQKENLKKNNKYSFIPIDLQKT